MGSSTTAQIYPPQQMQQQPQFQGQIGYSNPYQAAVPQSYNHVGPGYGQVPAASLPQHSGQQQQQQQHSYSYDSTSNGLKRPSDEALQSVDLYSKRPRPDSAGTVAFYPQRPGERLCSFYMTTRTCSFGVTCRFDHPAWVPFGGIPNWKEVTSSGNASGGTDSANLPQRPGEPNCSFYMKRGDCKYGQRCKFNHPKERRPNDLADSAGSSKEEGVTAAHNGSATKTTASVANGTTNGTAVNNGTTAVITAKTNSGGAPVKGNSMGERGSAKPAPLNSKGFPIRQGENECTFYVKTGSCKYGATCRFNHPEVTNRRPGPHIPTPNHQSPNMMPQMPYAAGSYASQMQPSNMGPQMAYPTADMKLHDTQALGNSYYQQWQQGQSVQADISKPSEMPAVSLSSYQPQWPTAPTQTDAKAGDTTALKMPSYTQHWQYPQAVQTDMKVSDTATALTSQYQQQWSCMPVQTDARVHDASSLGTTSMQHQWHSMPMQLPMQAVSYAEATPTLATSQYQQQWQCPSVPSDTRVNDVSGLALGTASYQQHWQCQQAQADATVSAGQTTGTAPYQWSYMPQQANVKVADGTPLVMSQYQQQWKYMPEQSPGSDALAVETSPSVKVDPGGPPIMPICPHPQRPGDPDCSYFLKTGECSFGASCKFHHPPGRVPTIPRVAPKLTLAGLPRREGETMCAYYLKTGACKYGSTCRFDHPPPGEAAAKLAAEPAEAAKLETVDSNVPDTQEIQEPKQTQPLTEAAKPAKSMQYVDLNLPSKPDDDVEVNSEA